MQNQLFDEKEWDVAGRLQLFEYSQFQSAKNFGEYVVILMEYANLKIVKIVDFRFVKLQDQLQRTMLMSAKGTPLNITPKLIIGDRQSDSKVLNYRIKSRNQI
ncbi:MAG: hypothetical protein EZS28_014796 [Streblomastix strix]|uniref:Uncharacterized protein n=1 Tax=Streblomastix strix TaxID=222440 RepID=A0A5J4W4Y9_9EUKA|nr:MAG: hypothetical protein EZS28_014796 [Streblomastix strix]